MPNRDSLVVLQVHRQLLLKLVVVLTKVVLSSNQLDAHLGYRSRPRASIFDRRMYLNRCTIFTVRVCVNQQWLPMSGSNNRQFQDWDTFLCFFIASLSPPQGLWRVSLAMPRASLMRQRSEKPNGVFKRDTARMCAKTLLFI